MDLPQHFSHSEGITAYQWRPKLLPQVFMPVVIVQEINPGHRKAPLMNMAAFLDYSVMI